MARAELDELLNHLLEFAKECLRKRAQFAPFGAAIAADGKMELYAVAPREPELPGAMLDSQVEIDQITSMLLAERDRLVATGICYDVLAQRPDTDYKSDAICVALEHVDGETVDVFLPYQKKRFGGIQFDDELYIEYEELYAVQGEARVFEHSAG